MLRLLSRIGLLIIALLSIAFLVLHAYTRKMMDHIVFAVSASPTPPSAVGAHSQTIRLQRGDRVTRAWLALPDSVGKHTPVVVIFRGIGESLSDWIRVQKMLADSGIMSATFDYGPLSDTAHKTGSSRLADVTRDVQDLIDSIRYRFGNAPNLFLLGHSVGNAVLLEMYPQIDAPFIKGIILCNAFASIKGWSIYHHKLSDRAAFFLPDYYDNTRNIKEIRQPVLLLHSTADSVNYFTDALQLDSIMKAQGKDERFIRFGTYSHNYIYGKDHNDYWAPILRFIRR